MNIDEIGCKWRFNPTGDYVVLDIHRSNFHEGTTRGTSPAYRKIMQRKDGTRYIRHDRKTWVID